MAVVLDRLLSCGGILVLDRIVTVVGHCQLKIALGRIGFCEFVCCVSRWHVTLRAGTSLGMIGSLRFFACVQWVSASSRIFLSVLLGYICLASLARGDAGTPIGLIELFVFLRVCGCVYLHFESSFVLHRLD